MKCQLTHFYSDRIQRHIVYVSYYIFKEIIIWLASLNLAGCWIGLLTTNVQLRLQ